MSQQIFSIHKNSKEVGSKASKGMNLIARAMASKQIERGFSSSIFLHK